MLDIIQFSRTSHAGAESRLLGEPRAEEPVPPADDAPSGRPLPRRAAASLPRRDQEHFRVFAVDGRFAAADAESLLLLLLKVGAEAGHAGGVVERADGRHQAGKFRQVFVGVAQTDLEEIERSGMETSSGERKRLNGGESGDILSGSLAFGTEPPYGFRCMKPCASCGGPPLRTFLGSSGQTGPFETRH